MRILLAFGLALSAIFVTPAFAQAAKPVVAVVEMRDLANSGQSDALSTMIETAVASTGKFRLIERQQINRLLAEQTRARGGVVTTNQPGRSGGFEGVDYLVYGTITSFSLTARANIGSSLLAGLASGQNASPQCSNTIATMALDIKITDAASGEIKYVTRISESQRSATNCGGNGQIDATLLLRSAADKIANGLVTAIYPMQIAAVQGDGQVVLNYGEGAVTTGQILAVYARGEPIRDPSTNEIIGTNETRLGFVRVTEVTGRLSRAAPVNPFETPPPVGSVVRPASPEDIRAMRRGGRR